MSLTATISGVSVDVMSLQRPDNIDQPTTCTVSIRDLAGTAFYQKGQPITITDSILGTIFTGFVHQPKATKLYPNTGIIWSMDCIAEGDFFASIRTSNWKYANQYSGTIFVDQVQRYLQFDGITAKAALRWDEQLTDWQQGTLSNTIATTNASDGNIGGGDLELALAGAATTLTVSSASDFNAGTNIGTSVVNGVLQPTPTPAIKLVGNCTLNNAGNLYSYMKIWNGSQSVTSNNNLIYDLWIDPASPEAKIAVDVVFSDGSNWRDTAVYYDAQNQPPHPGTDLTGLATGQWYHRSFFMGPYNGKTISYVTFAVEGDKPGVYTGYVKNIYLDQGGGVSIYFFQNTLNTVQQMQTYGYSSTSVSVINTYNVGYYTPQGEGSSPWTNSSVAPFWGSQAYSIDAVKILQSSYLSYTATVPTGMLLYIKYSLDYSGGVAAVSCTNNAPLPNLPAGLSTVGRSITLYATFYRDPKASPLASPEVCPSLSKVQLTLNPAYTMAGKTDVQFACTQASDWTQAGTTLTNMTTSFLANKVLSLNQYVRNWDDGSDANQTLYTTNGAQTANNRQMQVSCATGTDARSRLDFAGQFADFTAEVDILVASSFSTGIAYRTTNWGNNNDSYAYQVSVTSTQIQLGRGTNSTGAGAFTNIQTVSITLSSGNWHRLKVIAAGTSHKIYLDDVLFINTTDGTYTAAGYLGLRIYNNSGSNQAALFDNFGVAASLTGTWLSPNISLASATTYGTSLVQWRDQDEDSSNCTIKVESTINGGTNWHTCTSGQPLPSAMITAGQSLAGVGLQMRITLTTTTASSMAGIDNFIVRVLQQFNASGTRTSPLLSLAAVGRAGTTLVNWNALTPTNTSLTVQTSIDGGSTYQSVVSAGGAISGITTQPSPIDDTFSSNSSSSYTQGTFGSANGSWTWDTANSRLIGSGGNNGTLVYSTALTSADSQVMGDFDQSNGSGLIANYANANTMYYLKIWDNLGTGGSSNIAKLFRRSGGTSTQAGSTANISFTQGTVHRFVLDVEAGVITVSMDGTSIISYTDGSPLGAGQSGLVLFTLARVYSLRIQQYGQNVSNLNLLTKVTLTSADPTATPQLLDMQAFVSSTDIGVGTLIPSADYRRTFINTNIDDLNKQSNYWWYIRNDLSSVFQSRTATPAPFVLSSLNSQSIAGQTINDVLVDSAELDTSGDAYRNRMIMKNAIASSSYTEMKSGNGSARTWNVAHPLSAPPTSIVLNGLSQTFGIKNIDSGKNFYYQLGSTAIDQDASGTLLQSTDSFTITYTGSSTQDIQLDNTGQFSGTISQQQFAQTLQQYNLALTLFNQTQTVTTNGNSGDINVAYFKQLAVDIDITAVSGTTPSIQFFVDRKGSDGIYYPIWTSATFTATGQVSTSIGANTSIPQSLGFIVRFRWAISGTSPSFTFSASLQGRLDPGAAGLGVVESVVDASKLTVAAATVQGNQLLQRYGSIGRTFVCKTLRSGLVPGMQVALFVPEFNLNNVQMLITNVDVSLSPSPAVNGGLLYMWKLTMMEGPNLQSWVRLFVNGLGGNS